MSSIITIKSKQFIEAEINAISEYTERVFGVTLDQSSVRDLVSDLVYEKVEDYLYQRFRDWSVRDLLALEQALADKLGNASKATSRAPSEANKRSKRERAH